MDKIQFLQERVVELNRITAELEEVFPEKSFTLDGILVGNIIEVMASHMYGISLYEQSKKTHDGIVGNKNVQIKGTQGNDYITIKEIPEHLLVIYMDKKTGVIEEIYNGPGKVAMDCSKYVLSRRCYTIRVNKLLELNEQIEEGNRIESVFPVKKYVKKTSTTNKKSKKVSERGKTLHKGYVNKNGQENRGCLNKPGNHYNQQAYLLKCTKCGYEYEANGCDVAIRKCPRCVSVAKNATV